MGCRFRHRDIPLWYAAGVCNPLSYIATVNIQLQLLQ